MGWLRVVARLVFGGESGLSGDYAPSQDLVKELSRLREEKLTLEEKLTKTQGHYKRCHARLRDYWTKILDLERDLRLSKDSIKTSREASQHWQRVSEKLTKELREANKALEQL